MENVTVGWIKTDAAASESHVPTLWIGRRNVKLGSKNDLQVVLLDGYDRLGDAYREALIDTGYRVIDGSKAYRELSAKYPGLDRFGEYEKKCFLRWLVIKELYGRSPFIHYDGDVVFNETPENLERRFGKHTFLMQGCPCFSVIRDPAWMEIYEHSLDRFVADVEAYSEEAWAKREGYQRSALERWSGTRYRPVITSDQDLISHLIHTGQLPQDSPKEIMRNNRDVMMFESPLYFFFHYMDMMPMTYERRDGMDYFNGRKVAFWHMQFDFVNYLKFVYEFKYKWHVPLRIPNLLENRSVLDPFYRHIGSRFTRKYSRKFICQYFFEQADFSRVYDKRTFWYYPESIEDVFKLKCI
jgi:hypothetical protein